MNEPRRPLDEADIEFAERAVNRIADKERLDGGPRIGEDIGTIVRNLVTVSENLQETSKLHAETIGKIMVALDGAPLGDKTDGITYRLADMERIAKETRDKQNAAQAKTRTQLRAIMGGVLFIVSRITYVELPPVAHVVDSVVRATLSLGQHH